MDRNVSAAVMAQRKPGRAPDVGATIGDDGADLARRSGPIAVIAPCPFPANHGTPGSVREIVQTQVEKGYDVHVFTYPLREENLSLQAGPNVHRMPMLGFSRRIKVGPMWRKPLWNALIVLKIALMASKHKFKVIHAYNYEGALFGWIASLITRRPLVFHHFNTMIDELPTYKTVMPKWFASWLAKALDYWVPRMATKIVAISDPIEEFVLAKGIREERITKIPMGVDPSIFKNREGGKIRAEYGLGDRPLVMYAGLMNRFQRIDYLLEGMAEVRKTRPDARLMLVTNYIEPEDQEDCDRLLDKYDLRSSVVITEPQPFERVPDFLAAADVCVVSRPDCPGVPIKLLNYMAAGRPVVVPSGSSMNLTHRHDAYVVPDNDGRAIGRGVLELLEDEDLREGMGRNASATLDVTFGLGAICDRIGELYADLGNGAVGSNGRGA